MFIANHLYFLSAVYFSFWWIMLFFFNKKGRRAMLLLSFVGLIFGPLVQQMHLVDWWQPHFIFNTVIKFEDLMFGFAVAGTISSIYTIIRSKFSAPQLKVSLLLKIILVAATLFAVFGLFYLFNIHSFWSSLIGFSIPIFAAIISRPGLLLPMCMTGILITVIVLPGYLFGIYLKPAWVQNEWLLSSLSGKFFLGVPMEEFIWFFFAGVGLGAFQELFITSTELHNSSE